MKVKDQDLAEQDSNVNRHAQEDAASRDYAEQRKKAVKETEAKAEKQKKSDD